MLWSGHELLSMWRENQCQDGGQRAAVWLAQTRGVVRLRPVQVHRVRNELLRVRTRDTAAGRNEGGVGRTPDEDVLAVYNRADASRFY